MAGVGRWLALNVYMRAAAARLSEHGYQTPELSVVLHPFDGTEYGQEYSNLQKDEIVLELCSVLPNHQTGWAPANYLKRFHGIPWHLTFALPGASLMIQLVLPRCFHLADGKPVVNACNLGFPRPMKFDSVEAQYKYRRIHMSLSSKSDGWTSCEMAASLTRFTRLASPSVDGRPTAFFSEIVHGRLWFTSKEPIITAQ